MKALKIAAAVLTGLTALYGAEKLVFSCDFSNGCKPQTSIQPVRTDANSVTLIDIPGGKAVRVGKKSGKRAGRVAYYLSPKVNAAGLTNNMQVFPMRFGKLQFRFRPAGWSLKDSGHNMLLRMEGPRDTLLHVVFICPRGVPSVQVAYGQRKNPQIGKGELPVIYPFTKLDAGREWHDVTVTWSPSEVKLTVDGKTLAAPTKNLAYPEQEFCAERLFIGYGLANLSLGETDIADLKIWATEPESFKKKSRERFPELTVNPMSAPVIDGEISDREWGSVSRYTGFLKLPKAAVSEYQPEVQIGYDDKNLYLAIMSKGHTRPPVRSETLHDSKVWKDDSFELYFAPESVAEGNFYHIVLNHGGTVFDQYRQAGKNQAECWAWSCPGVRSATKVAGAVWSTEIAIPFASLNMKTPVPGSSLLFNLCENLSGIGYFSMAAIKTKFAEYEHFGVLKFGGRDSAVINFSDLGGLFRGEAAFCCGVKSKSPVQMTVSGRRYDQTADTEFALFNELCRVGETPQISFQADSAKLKKNGIIYTKLLQRGTPIYSGRFFYEAAMEAEIENIRREVKNGKNHLRIISVYMSDNKSRLRLNIYDKSGKKVLSDTVPISAMKQRNYLDISKLPVGEYTLGGELLDLNGKVYQSTALREFNVYGKVPPWHGFVNKNIKRDHVPAPWTPLKLQKVNGKLQVVCWNRLYVFGSGSLFAEQIITSGLPMLKSPVKLLLQKSGIHCPISNIRQKVISADDRRIVIESAGEADGGTIRVRAEIDYDGFIWFQMTPELKIGSRIEKLAVHLDMFKGRSTLLNSGFRDLQNTGATPAYWSKSLDGISAPFWVGMEKGGLSFGIESTEDWSNRKVTSQAEVFRKAAATTVALNIIDQPVTLRKRPAYGFYIHPTPVRPRPAGYRQLRTQDWFTHNKCAARSATFYPSNFSWWSTTWYYQGAPDWAVSEKDIAVVSKRLEKDYSKNKRFYQFDKLDRKQTRSAWYAAYSSVGRNAPEVIWQGDQWFAGSQERLYGNTLYSYQMDMIEVCKTDDYCDYYLWKFDKVKKAKPVIDGIYFDLWGAALCNRADHNHGYVTANGVRASVNPVRDHRKFMELIYLYCKEHAGNAPIVCHVSGATAHIAGYSYADYLLDGELWFHQLAQDRSYKSMSLDMARAEILPHIWGPGVIWLSELHRAKGYVAADQQKSWALEPWAMRHFSGILLLHDLLPDRTSLFETARKIWLALDKFKLADTDIMLPYWEKCGISGNFDGKNSAVTGYLKKAEKRLLLVVFNNNDHSFNVKVQLDTAKIFGTAGKVEVNDLESGKKLYSGAADFTVPVPVRNFRLLQVSLCK